jgi:hypothetical protein
MKVYERMRGIATAVTAVTDMRRMSHEFLEDRDLPIVFFKKFTDKNGNDDIERDVILPYRYVASVYDRRRFDDGALGTYVVRGGWYLKFYESVPKPPVSLLIKPESLFADYEFCMWTMSSPRSRVTILHRFVPTQDQLALDEISAPGILRYTNERAPLVRDLSIQRAYRLDRLRHDDPFQLVLLWDSKIGSYEELDFISTNGDGTMYVAARFVLPLQTALRAVGASRNIVRFEWYSDTGFLTSIALLELDTGKMTRHTWNHTARKCVERIDQMHLCDTNPTTSDVIMLQRVL